jgi:hypothetical protein
MREFHFASLSRSHLVALGLAAMLTAGYARATVLIQDNFNSLSSGTSLNGTSPSINNVNSNKWAASTSDASSFVGNGSGALNVNTNDAAVSASISLGASYFTANPGIYNLSLDVTEPAGGNANSAWVAVGFAAAGSTGGNFIGNTGAPWVLYRDSGSVVGFAGPTNTNTLSTVSVSNAATHTIDVQLNTLATNWTAAMFIDGVQEGSTFTYTTNPSDQYIAISESQNGTGQIVPVDNFTFSTSTVPEPTSLSLIGAASMLLLTRRRGQ